MRRLRGRTARDEAWRLVAAREDGRPIEGKRSLKQVRFAHRSWTIVLDQYTVSTGKSLYCWGYNVYGQIGDGTTSPRLSPKRIGSSVPSRTSAVSARV